MQIRDERIDLTRDLRFGQPVGRFDPVIERLSRIPWKHRPIKAGDWDNHYKRKCGDLFSDDLGFTARLMFNNKWFCTEKMEHTVLLEEYLSEWDIKDGSLPKTCPRCGKKFLTTQNFIVCPKCRYKREENKLHQKLFDKAKLERYIPWLDYQLDQYRNIIPNPEVFKLK